jgi:hypothetical protein
MSNFSALMAIFCWQPSGPAVSLTPHSPRHAVFLLLAFGKVGGVTAKKEKEKREDNPFRW